AGGYPEQALFEDLHLSRRLRERGRVITAAASVRTSARRLRLGGVVRTAGLFAWLKVRRALGADPNRLRARYPDLR
ncbi:MAG: TIGR04283 family arsenosugar biosynthesis glycosyltransferase, partial [Candidatus Limnocylindria bacterium]